MNILTTFLSDILFWLQGLTGNLGWSIIALTILIRSVLLPLTLPSLKATKKMRDVQPELKQLKKKHGQDKQAFQKAQLELYQKHNINPLAGCVPQIAQLVILIGLYQVLISFLHEPMLNGTRVATNFFWLDLTTADPLFIFPVLAAVTQLVLSLMIAPGAETPDIIPNSSKKKQVQEANKKEEDFAEMASSMQKQMLFIMPLMTGVVALQFPSGLALYWVVSTIYSLIQQYVISGPGGLVLYAQRAYGYVQKIFLMQQK